MDMARDGDRGASSPRECAAPVRMSLMLSSVRDAAEADIALAGGSDWVDVKEPQRGALGAPDPGELRRIVQRVGGRVPVSATIGDCWDRPSDIVPRVLRLAACALDFVKVGLDARRAGAAGLDAVRQCAAAGYRVIVVCAAERAPDSLFPEALADAGAAGVMLDTVDKAGPRLTELIGRTELVAFTQRARALGLLSGLAGRLVLADVPMLRTCGADYLGFRGALCAAGRREGRIDAQAFAQVREALSADERASMTSG